MANETNRFASEAAVFDNKDHHTKKRPIGRGRVLHQQIIKRLRHGSLHSGSGTSLRED
jgi:hypothetical protein